MADGEHELGSLDTANVVDGTRVLLAAFTTLIVASGSVVLWRRAVHRHALPIPTTDPDAPAQDSDIKPSLLHAALSSLRASPAEKSDPGHPADGGTGGSDTAGADYKSTSRSKERRRRGKDPLKELIKGGKRSKSLLKHVKLDTSTIINSSASAESLSTGAAAARHGPADPRADRNSRHGSVTTSSRSSSVSVSASRSSDEKGAERAPSPALVPKVDRPEEEVDAQAVRDTMPLAPPPPPMTISASAPVVDTGNLRAGHPTPIRVSQSNAVDSDAFNTLSPSTTSEPPSLSTRSHSPSASDAGSQSGSASIATASSSPPSSLSLVTDKVVDQHLPSSQSMPPHVPSFDGDNKPSGKNHNSHIGGNSNHYAGVGSWDWSAHAPANESSPATGYRKPPRFRSKSRASNPGSPQPTSLPYTLPFTAPHSSQSSSSAAVPAADAPLPSFTYPTLNPSPSPAQSPLVVPHSHNHNQHPRRTPTPSHTPPPNGNGGVSTQTQLASMRGALEAARMREEKSRSEAETYARECESLRRRWGDDVGLWRRRELDYQTQIHYLMHQLQAYVSLSAQHPSSPLVISHLQVPGASQAYPAQSSSQPASSHPPSPAPHSPPAPAHAQLNHNHSHNQTFSPFPAQQMMSPSALSPTTSPYASNGYPSSSAYPPNLFSLFFPGVTGPTVPSVSGASSAGSMSPVADFAQSPLHNRGRRRTRHGAPDDGWVITGDSAEGSEYQEADEDAENEFNDVLADAILKRPDSIRTKSKKSSAGSERPTVFTFPSLMDPVASENGYGEVAVVDQAKEEQAGDQVEGERAGDIEDVEGSGGGDADACPVGGQHDTPTGPSTRNGQFGMEKNQPAG